MLKSIQLIKRTWLSIRPPHRITRFGTVALSCLDERTPLERFCDDVDSWIDMIERRFRRRGRQSHVFHSFFDYSTGTMISSAGQIDAYLKAHPGEVYLTDRERRDEAARYRRLNKKEQHEKITKHMSEAYDKIKAGKSYVKEVQRQMNDGKHGVNYA